jgi:hypothetical protein
VIGKHVDFIAIALLLGGAAVYSEARNVTLLEAVHVKGAVVSQAIERAVKCPRSVRALRAIRVLPSLSVTTD